MQRISSVNLYIGAIAFTGILFCFSAIAILCLQWKDNSLAYSAFNQNNSVKIEQAIGDAYSDICEQIGVNVYLKYPQNDNEHYMSTKLDKDQTIGMLLSQLKVSFDYTR